MVEYTVSAEGNDGEFDGDDSKRFSVGLLDIGDDCVVDEAEGLFDVVSMGVRVGRMEGDIICSAKETEGVYDEIDDA